MKNINLVSFLSLIVLITACPEQSLKGTNQSCFKIIVCKDFLTGESILIYQTCSNKWYITLVGVYNNTPIENINRRSLYNEVKDIKITSEYLIINYEFQIFLYYHYYHNSTKKIIFGCQAREFDALILKNGSYCIFAICNNSVVKIIFENSVQYSNTTVKLNSVGLIQKASYVEHTMKCWISTIQGQLFIFDIQSMSILSKLLTDLGPNIAQLQGKGNQTYLKSYVATSKGHIYEFFCNLLPANNYNSNTVSTSPNLFQDQYQNQQIYIQRYSHVLEGAQITSMQSTLDDKYLLIGEQNGILNQIDLTDGKLITQIDLKNWLTNKNQTTITISNINSSFFIVMNVPNNFYSTLELNSLNNIDNATVCLFCYSHTYYNASSQICKTCSDNCSTCDPITGDCLTCIDGYFLKQKRCYSCYYSSQSLTTYLDVCFSGLQSGMMKSSQKMVSSLSVVISNFANILNICGILFIFVKLINNWNLISLYFFLPIPKMPFFMLNILIMIFNNFNSSVLQTINININTTFDLQDISNNQKFVKTNISTDFAAFNGQSIILFIYSVILILTLYKIINFFFAKINISIFQDNDIISILQEFVGSFTTSLLPMVYIISGKNKSFTEPIEKINSLCFYILTGFAVIVPFLFLVIGHRKTGNRTNKIKNQTDKQAFYQVLNRQMHHKVRQWNIQANRQRFFYSLQSFSISLLCCNDQPLYFLIVVGLIHFMSLINVFYSSRWKVNNIIQKLNFLLFHMCFVLLFAIQEDSIKFIISIVVICLIIIGGIHELISTIFKKIYFVYIVVKGKIQEKQKINNFFEKNKSSKQLIKRTHPITMQKVTTSTKIIQKRIFTFKKFEATIVKQTNNFQNSLRQTKDRKQNTENDYKKSKLKIKSSKKANFKSIKIIEQQPNYFTTTITNETKTKKEISLSPFHLRQAKSLKTKNKFDDY